MAYCEKCGSPLSADALFCGKCGAPVASHSTEKALEVAETAARIIANSMKAPDMPGEFVVSTWSADQFPTLGGVAAQAAQAAQGAARRAAQQGLSGETAQFQAHDPEVRRSSADHGGTTAKKKSKLPIVIAVVLAVVVVALLALYVVPRFIWHPVDPNEHTALVSSTSQSSSATSTSSASATSEGKSESTGSIPGSSGVTGSTGSQQSSTSASSTSAVPPTTDSTGFSTVERPTISEFAWLTGDAAKGNVPAGATRLVNFADVEGGWKAYLFGSNKEWLLNADIQPVQGGVAVTLDWYYLRDGSTGESREDTTPKSLFNGSFDGGMLDATGSGRITIAAFWQQDGHQYATGSFIWPSGETATIALVRP